MQAHAISHLERSHPAQPDQEQPDQDVPTCAECLEYGHLAAAAPSLPLAWMGLPVRYALATCVAPANPERLPTLAYHSRAPPVVFSSPC